MNKKSTYLVHYGVKGMKWKNHTYKSIVGGEYIYDTAQIQSTAHDMKAQGYSTVEIRNKIRADMAKTRSANATSGGNYSGAMDRAKQKVAEQTKPAATQANTNSKYQSELNKAKANAATEAANKEKELEQKHATYEKEKAERKEQKEKERAAQEAAAAAEEAEKEAKKNKKKGSGGSKKKGSSKKSSAEDKKKQQEELQKKIDEGVKKELEKMGLSSQVMSKDGEQKGELSDEQLDSLANKVIRGDLGNGSKRKAALGDYYQDVQRLVNKKMSAKAEVAKGAKPPEKQKEIKWTGSNKKVKHTVIVGTNYLVHHGTEGQKWYRRRYQNYDGSLTPLGREHYGVGPSRYQNADGTLTKKGIKKYTTLDKKTGARYLNRKGEKFYRKFEDKVTKQMVKDVEQENKKAVQRRAILSDEEIEQLTNRINAEKKLRDAYGNTSISQQVKDQIAKSLAKKGSEFVVDVALGAAAAAGQKAVEKSLNGKIGSLKVDDFIDNNKMEVNRERVNKMAEAEKAAKADYEAAVARNKAEKDRIVKVLNGSNAQGSMDAVSIMGKKNAEARKQYEKVLNDLNRAKENYEKSYDEERRQASDRLMADLKRRRENNYNTAKLIFPTPGSRDKK